jgi:hypothetical protein
VECRRCISDNDMHCEKKLSLESNRSIFRRNSNLIVFINLLTTMFKYAQTYALYICTVEARKIAVAEGSGPDFGGRIRNILPDLDPVSNPRPDRT